MRTEICNCDRCGLAIESKNPRREFALVVGRSSDGVEMSDDYDGGDYCVLCVRNALQQYFKPLGYDEAKKFLKILKGK